MKNIIKKIISPRNLGITIAIISVTAATAAAAIPAYKSWLIQGTNLYTTGTNVGIEVTNPTEKLDVNGTVQMTGFKMPTGALPGGVLTSDAAGVGTWQPGAGGGIGGSGTTNRIPKFTSAVTIGNSVMYQAPASGNIGIGTIAPVNSLSVLGGADVSYRLGIGISAPLVNELEVDGKAAIGTTYAGNAAPANGLIVEGDVGIGLMIPMAKLHIVQSGANPAFRVDQALGTTQFVIKNGDVGIGTIAPSERLDLDGGNIKMGYEIVSVLGSTAAPVTASCPVGTTQKKVIGGGCYASTAGFGLEASYPSSDIAWTCGWPPTPGGFPAIAYAICADIR